MIGNFILMPLDRERQERLYADHLRPIERGFERHGEEHFDVFIRDFLTLRTGEVPKQGEEYAAFKTHARSRRVEDAGSEALSADLRSCADHYRAMVLGEEPDAELALAFGELARLDMKPVWPFLLHLYGDYVMGGHGQAAVAAVRRLLSGEHFSVGGMLFGAWASIKSFRPVDKEPPGEDGGGDGTDGGAVPVRGQPAQWRR